MNTAPTSRITSAASKPSVHISDTDEDLTPRETAILKLIGQGMTSKEIAEQLFITKRTVDFHLSNVYAKFQPHINNNARMNRMKAYRYAMSKGLLA